MKSERARGRRTVPEGLEARGGLIDNPGYHKRWLTGGFCDMGTRELGGGTNFMPIYEYQAESPDKGCKLCREGFEYIQRIDEKPVSHCRDCGKRVKRII